jgi:hypothetical protein
MFADLDAWRGVRSSMSAGTVADVLRANDPTIEIHATSHDLSITGNGWRATVSLDDQECIYGDILVSYEPPLGRAGARAVLAQRLAEYGPPRAVRLVPRGLVQVEWSGRAMDASVALRVGATGTFTAFESYGPASTRRGEPVEWAGARAVIARACAANVGERRAECEAIATAFAILDELGVRAPLIDTWNALAALRDELDLERDHRDAGIETMFVIVDNDADAWGRSLQDELSRWAYTRGWSIRDLAMHNDLRDLLTDPAAVLPPRAEARVIEIEGRFAASVAPRIAGARPDGMIVRVLAPAAPLPIDELDERVFDVPGDEAGSRKWTMFRTRLFPIRVTHRPTGRSVYINLASSLDEARLLARRVLAARVAEPR